MTPPASGVGDGSQDAESSPPADGARTVPSLPGTHTLLLAAIVACLLVYLWQHHQRRSSTTTGGRPPPGPTGLPLIGSLLELRGNPIRRLREIAQEYGPIFTIKLGLVRLFVLSEVDIIHEAFVTKGNIFNDRPAFLGALTGAGNTKGIVVLPSGPFHRYQRLFAAEIMRVMGIGQLKGERYFKTSAAGLCQHLAVSEQRPLEAKTTIAKFVFYTLANFLFGGDLDTINSMMSLRDSPSELFHLNPAFVLASKVLPNFIVNWLMPNKKQLLNCFLEILERRRRHFVANPEAAAAPDWETYVDGILAIQRESERQIQQSGSGDHGDGNQGHLMDRATAALAPDDHYAMVFFDFFTVGSETSLVGLLWVLQMVMFHPQWQTRIQEELDEVVGAGTPSLSHKSRLHVTMAVITEVYRFRPTSALGAPHRVAQDSLLGGYLIPEGSLLLSNIFAANNDRKLWRDPDTFDPGRFLDEKGQFNIPQRIMTFSTGQRSCPGEKWTRSMIFLFTTTILKRFSLTFPDGEKLPDATGHPGINYSPHPFKICATPR